MSLRRAASDDRGQVLVLSVLFLVPLLLLGGVQVVDIGLARVKDGATQAQADSAALAGAVELPDTAAAAAMAETYLEANTVEHCASPRHDITFPDAETIRVEASCDSPTAFAGLVGLDHIEVGSVAEAQRGEPYVVFEEDDGDPVPNCHYPPPPPMSRRCEEAMRWRHGANLTK